MDGGLFTDGDSDRERDPLALRPLRGLPGAGLGLRPRLKGARNWHSVSGCQARRYAGYIHNTEWSHWAFGPHHGRCRPSASVAPHGPWSRCVDSAPWCPCRSPPSWSSFHLHSCLYGFRMISPEEALQLPELHRRTKTLGWRPVLAPFPGLRRPHFAAPVSRNDILARRHRHLQSRPGAGARETSS